MPNDTELDFYEQQDKEHKAAIQAARERYEALDGVEVLCGVCGWRQASAFTKVCSHCEDAILAVREVR